MKIAKPRIIVVGGGFGGLEAALYMRMRMPEAADITMVSDQEHFLFKPNTIYIPFGLDPSRLKFHLSRPAKRKNIKLVQSLAREIDPITKQIYLDGQAGDHSDVHNNKIAYDYLVVATGAGARPEEVPGLQEFGHIVWTPEQMLDLHRSLHELAEEAKAGTPKKVLFLVPPDNRSPGPLYEIAMLLDTWLRRKHIRSQVDISWSTCEGAYLQGFGPRLHSLVADEFTKRDIAGYTSYMVDRVQRGEVVYHNGERLPFDLLLSLPPQGASTRFESLPVDKRGFITTDIQTGQVEGYPDIYAVGDTVDFHVKQAYLASLQADAAADHLSARVLCTMPSVLFDPVTRYVIEGFGRATFAQVPLELTGKWDVPTDVRAGAGDLYRVGSSPIWRLGKLALGVYLPWRFKAGNPFHSGVPWKGMEAGLKLMSGMLAK
ncbi:MAG: FAD-dependent oxidoreductase [Chloroflexota bacterium]